MDFKLFVIDRIELAHEQLMSENAPCAGVCYKINSATSRCTRNTRNIVLNTVNDMYMIINTVYIVLINQIGLAYKKLILDNVLGARVSNKNKNCISTSTGPMNKIFLNTRNYLYMNKCSLNCF